MDKRGRTVELSAHRRGSLRRRLRPVGLGRFGWIATGPDASPTCGVGSGCGFSVRMQGLPPIVLRLDAQALERLREANIQVAPTLVRSRIQRIADEHVR